MTLQDQGLDTVEANLALGFRADPRDYGVGLQILQDLGLSKVRLLTNNPKKTDAFVIHGHGLEVVDQVPIIAPDEADRRRYLPPSATRWATSSPRADSNGASEPARADAKDGWTQPGPLDSQVAMTCFANERC